MENKKSDIQRNTPAEKGINNDPYLRDHSGIQPGASTIRSSNTDDLNSSISETAADKFNEEEFGKGADRTFDETDEEK